MRNKKGQFYLIASIILIALFLSFISLMNYSIKVKNPEIYKYVEELNLEGKKVLDYDAVNGGNEFEDFAKNYSYYVGDGRKIYFITGEIGSLSYFTYEEEARIDLSSNVSANGNNRTLDINGNNFTFEMQPGQNFYFVMTDTYRNQEYYITNDE